MKVTLEYISTSDDKHHLVNLFCWSCFPTLKAPFDKLIAKLYKQTLYFSKCRNNRNKSASVMFLLSNSKAHNPMLRGFLGNPH